MRAYGTPHALIFPIYGWSLTHIERSFFAALLKERGRGQLTGCFRPFLTCAKRRACGFSAGPSTLMRKIGFLLSFCGGVFSGRGFFCSCMEFLLSKSIGVSVAESPKNGGHLCQQVSPVLGLRAELVQLHMIVNGAPGTVRIGCDAEVPVAVGTFRIACRTVAGLDDVSGFGSDSTDRQVLILVLNPP